MISKTAMLDLVRGFRAAEVERAFAGNPALFDYRDERGRNWLHICCASKAANAKVPASLRTASVLLARGYDMNGAAFTEGTWRATPVWYTVSRGENLALTEFLLKRGADPNHSLWAASFRNDRAAIRLLVGHGARLEDVVEDTTPFLGAVKWSKFGPAEELLEAGADPNYRDKQGMTALHYMLKKASDKKHIAMVVRHAARGDIKDKAGKTAIDILRRKKDPALRQFAEELAAAG
jgi:hypothetical protein